MSLSDRPEARALLADAVLTPEAVRGCGGRLAAFLGRHLPRFCRAEQRATASLVIGGLLSGLQRKTCEPVAVQAGVHRKPIRFLVGAGGWDDEAAMAGLRRRVAEELGDDRAVPVIGGGTFPKTGAGSCGAARRWCGRLGEQENRQAGVLLIHAAPGGYAPPDRRLDLPGGWADDVARRGRCHVPEEVTSRERWRIAADLLERSREGPPHGRVTGDGEFGRPAHFRAWLRGRRERYVLDVPGDAVARGLGCRRPRRGRAGRGAERQVPCRRVDARAARQPEGRRARLTIRAGERGPLRVDAMTVRTKLDRKDGPEERLVAMRAVGEEPETHSALSNAGPEVAPEELVRARFTRRKVEGVLEASKQETGLAHYEVRGWVGCTAT